MRTLMTGAAIAALVVALAACGSSGKTSAAGPQVQKDADLYLIDQIEQTWHKAASTHDIDLMMTIWAPDATFTIGGQTASGKAAIRKVLAAAGPFQLQNHWVSETPAYKIRTTVNSDKGTLYFECHYVDVKTAKVVKVVGADQDVQKINGTWLITNSVASSPTLKP
ncbi:MAG: YybH family protein [Gaiellaceae bacterium]